MKDDRSAQCLANLMEEKNRIEESIRLQADVWEGRKPKRQPLLLRCSSMPAFDEKWPAFDYLEIYDNPEKMFSNGLREAFLCLLGGAEAVPSIRANMGCGIIPTMFGIRQQVFYDKMPWVTDHLSKERLKEMQPGDLRFGDDLRMAFRHMDYIAGRLGGGGCLVYPLDLQGAFDTAHIVYGDAIFIDLFDDPGFVHHLLELSCHAVETAMDECFRHIPGAEKTIAHYNGMAIPRSRGGVKISEDTSTLLSRSQIDEFVIPYLSRLLRRFGGGYVHYCGKNPHLYQAVLKLEQAFGLNFGNPEMHDMNTVLRDCAARGKVYYGGIPRSPGEDWSAYFQRVLLSSHHEGKHWILPEITCDEGEQTEMVRYWRHACELAVSLTV